MPNNTPGLVTYVCDRVDYKRKDNHERWINVEEITGKEMYRGYPAFEFIPGARGEEEPLRFGDFVIDIDTEELACKSGILIIDYFDAIYGIEPDQWSIYLSGKKGIHLELPDYILGTESGHKLLPLGYKRLAKDIEGDLGIKLDTSMYNRGTGKPYRQPNIIRRDTKTCKRQIDYNDLCEIITHEEYIEACSTPGAVWRPPAGRTSDTLAKRMAAYLSEAEKHQEDMLRTPALSDDDLDRLALSTPPCISLLANLTSSGGTSATFNDVAIQLTGYAITTGRTEEEFLAGCRVFIEGYPSSSLNTLQKRVENARARYRTMAANGNQHSCGGVKSLRFPGFDCSSCNARGPGPYLAVEVMSQSDISCISASLQIPEKVLNPGGLISLATESLLRAGAPNIPQFTLPVVLTSIARAISGKLQFDRCWPNVYNIKIGPTSLGKTEIDKIMREAIDAVVPGEFYGPTGFSSGPALMRALTDNPQTIVVLDECTNLFRRYQRADPLSDGIRDALLEIYSNSGGKIRRVYSDSKKSINVDYPCLNIIGNATLVVFDSIKSDDFATGTIQRFDFWCYDGPALPRVDADSETKGMDAFAHGIAKICASVAPSAGNLAPFLGIPHALGATDTSRKAIRAWSEEIISAVNYADGGDGPRGIISRKYNLAIKYAMIHLAGTRPVESLYDPMDLSDFEYGQAVADMLSGWKLDTLTTRINQGDFHRDCEIFKGSIASILKLGKRPTFKMMANRRPELKNWKLRDSQEIIDVLVKRGEVVLDESKRTTAYYLVK